MLSTHSARHSRHWVHVKGQFRDWFFPALEIAALGHCRLVHADCDISVCCSAECGVRPAVLWNIWPIAPRSLPFCYSVSRSGGMWRSTAWGPMSLDITWFFSAFCNYVCPYASMRASSSPTTFTPMMCASLCLSCCRFLPWMRLCVWEKAPRVPTPNCPLTERMSLGATTWTSRPLHHFAIPLPYRFRMPFLNQRVHGRRRVHLNRRVRLLTRLADPIGPKPRCLFP